MTRILYWNISNFGENKVNNTGLRKRKRHEMMAAQWESQDRRALILSMLIQSKADIFVVVEVNAPADLARGAQVTSSGATGVMHLLAVIRHRLGAKWMVVPALSCGGSGKRAEGIAIFYNSAAVTFVGPRVLTAAGPVHPPGLPPAVATLKYEDVWGGALPALPTDVVPTDRGLATGGYPLAHVAAKTDFTTPGPLVAQVGFPTDDFRSPLLAQFLEVGGGKRVLDVFAFHADPHLPKSQEGTAALAAISEFTAAPTHPQVIVGDFNVNLWSDQAPAAYDPLLAAPLPGFVRALNDPMNDPGRPYVMTHLRPPHKALPYGKTGYPGFGYLGSLRQYQAYSIDNILTRGAVASKMTVLNPVVGSPYDMLNPAPGPTGTLDLEQLDSIPIDHLPGGPASSDPGARSHFKSWDCFGVIHSTSDHLPLVIDI